MTDTLTVRAYNVGFGDAILVTVPDRGADDVVVTRRILIDVGNVLSGAAGDDARFEPVLQHLVEELDGDPIDLYVMTHEHLDHVQGLLWAKEKAGLEVTATHAWLTASAAPDYYDRFPEARKKRLALLDAYNRIALHLARLQLDHPGDGVDPRTVTLLANNNPRRTADCVEHLRTIADTTTYLSRNTDLRGTHPFVETTFEIWAPEPDTSTYYGRFKPMGLGVGDSDGDDGMAAPATTDAPADGAAAAVASNPVVVDPEPPPGVDAGAFYDLVDRRRRGIHHNLRQIDKAANETSLVFCLQWRGWDLLFCGDAEERSWKHMHHEGVVHPVHFIKVGHHGSHNGTPTGDLLEAVLPVQPHDDRPRSALVSTCVGAYNGVPHDHTLDEIGARVSVVARVGAEDDPLFIELDFPDLDH